MLCVIHFKKLRTELSDVWVHSTTPSLPSWNCRGCLGQSYTLLCSAWAFSIWRLSGLFCHIKQTTISLSDMLLIDGETSAGLCGKNFSQSPLPQPPVHHCHSIVFSICLDHLTRLSVCRWYTEIQICMICNSQRASESSFNINCIPWSVRISFSNPTQLKSYTSSGATPSCVVDYLQDEFVTFSGFQENPMISISVHLVH